MAFPTTPTDGQEYRKWIYIASLGAWRKKPETPIGSIFPVSGPVQSPSNDFPNFCATNFTGSTIVPSTLPYLTMRLRERAVDVNGVSNFSGSVSGSTITLDSTTESQELVADMLEWRLDFGTYTGFLSGDIDGTTHEITNIDAGALQITFATTPTAGTQNLTIYPHRIAGSTTTARVHSLAGKAFVGAGTTEIMSMGMRRDRMQGHHHNIQSSSWPKGVTGGVPENPGPNINARYVTGGSDASGWDGTGVGVDHKVVNPITDTSGNGTPRTGTDTHSADYAGHMYYVGGPYVAA